MLLCYNWILVFNNGITIQYGISGNNGTNRNTITFPISFSSRNYGMVATDWNGQPEKGVFALGIDINNRTSTQCDYVSAPGTLRGSFWLCIGN